MARTIDPRRHAARRQQILDAAFTCFARHGYDGTTTAAISRVAGIGSGTLFHYFPSKVSVLLAILAAGTQDTRDWFGDQDGRRDARGVVLDWIRHTADAAADPRLPGFIRAVGARADEAGVAAALAADDDAQRSALIAWIGTARQSGDVRADLPTTTLTSWVMLVLDGFLARLASDESFTVLEQRDVLIDAVDRFLEPQPPARHDQEPPAFSSGVLIGRGHPGQGEARSRQAGVNAGAATSSTSASSTSAFERPSGCPCGGAAPLESGPE